MLLLNLIRRNRYFFGLYALALIGVGTAQLLYSQEQLMQWVNARNSVAADYFFTYATYLGDGAFFVAVCLLLTYYNRRVGLLALASFALSSLTSLFLKLVAFPDSLRPLKTFEHSTFEYHIIKGLNIYSYNSFPSGHTTSAFALFGLLAFLDERKNRGWLWFALAALTGYSRVYLFQHFVEDAYVGSIVGTTASVLVYVALRRWVFQTKRPGTKQTGPLSKNE